MKINQKVFYVVSVLLAIFSTYILIVTSPSVAAYTVTFNYEENQDLEDCQVQLLYATGAEEFDNALSCTDYICEGSVSFSVSIDDTYEYFKIYSPNEMDDYHITSIVLENYLGDKRTYVGKDISKIFKEAKRCATSFNEASIYVIPSDNNSYLFFDAGNFCENTSSKSTIYRIFVPGLLGLFLLYYFFTKDSDREKQKHFKKKQIVFIILLTVFTSLTGIVFYGMNYIENNFSGVPIGQIIYHLNTPLEGTAMDSYIPIILQCIGLVFGIVAANLLLAFFCKKLHRLKGHFYSWLLISIVVCFSSLYNLAIEMEVPEYWAFTHCETTLYEDEYVDPATVSLTFPEQKRNLIYIFLESMETTYSDTENGGAMKQNYIPELTELAEDNITFSGSSNELNGPHTVNGAEFTMGAIVAQTSGTPINENLISNSTLNSNWESENNYLPGVYTIGDVLDAEGYNQLFLMGSDATFAGRSSYLKGHGNYDILDYTSAINENLIPSTYKVWWGFEDCKLFEYAKDKITALASEDQPFNVSMLTVDTHFTDGYVCQVCQSDYKEQYSNVIACSSRQVSEFVEWVQEQDFYENTTIVICGDHPTMDSSYIERNDATNYDRRMYFTIINPASNVANDNEYRDFTSFDLYPTTLAALGVEIEGDRLGLGVNLFSDQPTLMETYGLDTLNEELLMDSKFYRKTLMYGK